MIWYDMVESEKFGRGAIVWARVINWHPVLGVILSPQEIPYTFSHLLKSWIAQSVFVMWLTMDNIKVVPIVKQYSKTTNVIEALKKGLSLPRESTIQSTNYDWIYPGPA